MHDKSSKNSVYKGIDFSLDLLLAILILLCLLLFAYTYYDNHYVLAQAERYQSQDADPYDAFLAARKKNQEVIAWIKVSGTGISYPVLQTDNNDFYMTHDAEKNEATSGSVFLDYQNQPDFSDFSSILYAHNLAGSYMFGDIKEYADSSFFETHRKATLYLPGEQIELEAVCYLKSDAYDNSIYHSYNDPDAFISEVQALSLVGDSSVLSDSDQYVCLSTCSIGVENERHVLVFQLGTRTPRST